MSKFPFLPWNLSSKRKSQWLDSIIYYCFNNTCYRSDKMMYQLQSGHRYYHARYSLFCRRGFVQNYENYNSKKSWTKFLAFVNLFDGAISYLTCYSSMTIKSRLLPLQILLLCLRTMERPLEDASNLFEENYPPPDKVLLFTKVIIYCRSFVIKFGYSQECFIFEFLFWLLPHESNFLNILRMRSAQVLS